MDASADDEAPQRSTFAGAVRFHAQRRPASPAVTAGSPGAGWRTIDWATLDAESSRVAQALLAAGVGPGDVLAHCGRNSLEYVLWLYGASKVGAAVAGFNWRSSVDELAALTAAVAPKAMLVGAEFAGSAVAALAAADVSALLIVEGGTDPSAHPGSEAIAFDTWTSGHTTVDPGRAPQPDDLALVFCTSGTTGRPKLVPHLVGRITNNLRRPIPWTMDETSTVLVVSPVFHTAGAGWVYLSLFGGGHLVLLRDADPASVLATIATWQVTEALLVPSLIQFVLLHPDVTTTDLRSLRTVTYGASPIAASTLAAALATFGCEFVQAYGMTETNGPVTYLGPEDHDPSDPNGRLRSAGRPPEGIEIRIVDPDTGVERAVGDVGEVWTRSDQQFLGYLNGPDDTAATLVADGWLRTGDAGHVDGDGYLYLTDRIKDMIVTGAENVYPAEVENVLHAHPDIAEAAVVGVPDERWGETVKAIVVPRDGRALDAAQIIEFCRSHLAHYKCPTSVDVATALPRNPAGKVLRRELREPFWAGRTRRVG